MIDRQLVINTWNDLRRAISIWKSSHLKPFIYRDQQNWNRLLGLPLRKLRVSDFRTEQELMNFNSSVQSWERELKSIVDTGVNNDLILDYYDRSRESVELTESWIDLKREFLNKEGECRSLERILEERKRLWMKK